MGSFLQQLKAKIGRAENPYVSDMYLKTRELKRRYTGKRFEFVTIGEATDWTIEWIKTFPRQFDLIVGVPRSGMFVASLIALKLGKGLTAPALLEKGEYWQTSVVKDRLSFGPQSHVLIVDDSMDSGRSMSRAVDQVRSVNKDINISRGCLIIREEAKHLLDLYHRVVSPPRLFEWNILHRKIASYMRTGVLAVEMDGILCAPCPAAIERHEKTFSEWLLSARPYLVPYFEIDAIVTGRLEKYRPQTEQWLANNGVGYKELFMRQEPVADDGEDSHPDYFVGELLRIKPDLCWTRRRRLSDLVWKSTRIPTLCIDDMTLLN